MASLVVSGWHSRCADVQPSVGFERTCSSMAARLVPHRASFSSQPREEWDWGEQSFHAVVLAIPFS
jgi:hypothetical protein